MKYILALILAISVPSVASELYEVLIHRPHKVGEKFAALITASVDSVMTFSANGRVVNEQKVDASCSVEGELEILAVDKKGRISSATLKVTKADGKVEGKAAQLFKVGDVIASKRSENGKETVTVNEDESNITRLELARLLVPTSSATSVTDDEVFGPGKSVGVGEEWAISSKAASEWFSEFGRLTPDQIKGSVKVTGDSETDGQKCLQLRSRIGLRGGGFALSGPDVPEWMKVRTLEIDADLDSSVPSDPNAFIPRTKMAMIMDVVAAG